VRGVDTVSARETTWLAARRTVEDDGGGLVEPAWRAALIVVPVHADVFTHPESGCAADITKIVDKLDVTHGPPVVRWVAEGRVHITQGGASKALLPVRRGHVSPLRIGLHKREEEFEAAEARSEIVYELRSESPAVTNRQ